jgi:uncharacterized membrane protein YcaP (DUF421 family)
MQTIWTDMLVSGVPLVEKVLRTIAVYVFLLAGLRVFGKRELGALNPLDVIVLLLLSNTVQNAIIGNDNSLVGGLVGAAVLFVVNQALVRYAYRNPRVRRLIEGRTEEVMRDGRVINAALTRNMITRDELEAAARKQGIEHLSSVECARLELSGALSFTLKEPGELERVHRDIVARLTAIEARLPAAMLLIALGAGLAAAPLGAQARPQTDVWIVPLKQSGSTVALGAPRNLTHRIGYDNQPSFTATGDAVLYTATDNGQSDIWRVPVRGGAPKQLTHTSESEYSATVTPDGRFFSVIRVEADSTQRLWKFPVEGDGAPSLVIENIKPVGYHVWAGDHTLFVYVLGGPLGSATANASTLQLVDDRIGTGEIVARNVGRALQRIPGRDAISYIQTVKDSASWITEYDLKAKQSRRLVIPPKGADYHVWTPNGALIVATESKVYMMTDEGWGEIADFTSAGVKGITRLAMSPKGAWLAFVAEDKTAP